jgi:hypothetical protein
MANKDAVAEKSAMLTNIPGGKEAAETKEAPRVLSELESAKVEIINLNQQITKLRQENLGLQKRVIAVQEESLKLQEAAHAKDADKLLADLGLSGSVNLLKTDDGRYVIKK